MSVNTSLIVLLRMYEVNRPALLDLPEPFGAPLSTGSIGWGPQVSQSSPSDAAGPTPPPGPMYAPGSMHTAGPTFVPNPTHVPGPTHIPGPTRVSDPTHIPGPPMHIPDPPMHISGPPMHASGPPMHTSGPPMHTSGPPMHISGPPTHVSSPTHVFGLSAQPRTGKAALIAQRHRDVRPPVRFEDSGSMSNENGEQGGSQSRLPSEIPPSYTSQ